VDAGLQQDCCALCSAVTVLSANTTQAMDSILAYLGQQTQMQEEDQRDPGGRGIASTELEKLLQDLASHRHALHHNQDHIQASHEMLSHTVQELQQSSAMLNNKILSLKLESSQVLSPKPESASYSDVSAAEMARLSSPVSSPRSSHRHGHSWEAPSSKRFQSHYSNGVPKKTRASSSPVTRERNNRSLVVDKWSGNKLGNLLEAFHVSRNEMYSETELGDENEDFVDDDDEGSLSAPKDQNQTKHSQLSHSYKRWNQTSRDTDTSSRQDDDEVEEEEEEETSEVEKEQNPDLESKDSLARFLMDIDLYHYMDRFTEGEVNLQLLLLLNDQQLEELGVGSFGARLRIRIAADKFVRSCPEMTTLNQL